MSRDPGAAGVVLLVIAGLACVAPAAYLVGSTLSEPEWRVGFEAAFQTWTYYAVPWLLGAAVALTAVAFRQPALKALGLGLMTVPFWETLWGILDSLVELLQGGFVLRAFTRPELSRIYSTKLLSDLGYLGAGFLLFAGGRRLFDQTPATIAARLASLGFPMGGRNESRSAFIGLLGFPLLLIGTLGVNFLTQGLESLRQSDESSVFANMTVYHAVLISFAAAFGEELVYRGFFQTLLGRRMPMLAAVLAQALFFGFAHGGYATWIHVLLPTLFGIVAGVVAWRFGIWAAIVLHLVVDLFAFFAEVAARELWIWTLINAAFLANIALSLGWAIYWLVQRYGSGARPV